MTSDQLQALAARLRDHAAMHESVIPYDDEQRQWRDDLLDAAEYLRQCAQAEPVATVRVHDTGGNAGIAWSGVPTENAGTMRGGTPLYTHPQPPSAPARCCTCHPDDNPPAPCVRQYALSECRKVAAQAAQADAWREAVIDALVVAHIYRKEHDNDPRKAIQDLLVYEAELAVDPLVSVEARSLIEQGKREAAQADAIEALRQCAEAEHAIVPEGWKLVPVEPTVATVTECEACFTPDACQLRGVCDHFAAEQLRVVAQQPPSAQARRQALEARTASEMTRDEIIKLAMEAGIPIETDWAGRPSTLVIKDGGTYLRGIDDLVRFAELVAADLQEEEL